MRTGGVEQAVQTPAAVFEKFLDWREVHKNITQAMRNNYRWRWDSFADWLETQSITDMQAISAEVMDQYFAYLKGRKDQRATKSVGRTLSDNSRHTHWTSMRAFFNWAKAKKFITENPMRPEDQGGCYVKKPGHRQKTAPKREVIEKILNLFDPKNPPEFYEHTDLGKDRTRLLVTRNRALVALLAGCGLRAFEALNLQVEHIDWKEFIINFQAKGNREDTMPLPPDVRAVLAEYKEERDTMKGIEGETRFFLTFDGRPMQRDALRRLFQTITHAVGVKLTPHQLRYFAGCAFYAKTRDLILTQKFLRQASPLTTAHYLGFDSLQVRQAILGSSPVAGMLRH